MADLSIDRSCAGKTGRYPDKAAARRAADNARAERGGKWHPYKCLYCPDWHIGHRSRTEAHSKKRSRTFQDLAY